MSVTCFFFTVLSPLNYHMYRTTLSWSSVAKPPYLSPKAKSTSI